MLKQCLAALPLVAILRGVQPDEVVALADGLAALSWRIVEVPLNSPKAYDSIAALSAAFGEQMLVGAGTVLSCEQVDAVAESGGKIIIMPHSDIKVIRHAKSQGLYCVPGFMTPTEAFAAIDAGADGLKCFPANLVGAAGLKAMMAVLPDDVPLLPVGGINPEHMPALVQCGATGFGLGSSLYRPGDGVVEVVTKAREFIRVWQQLSA